jgi:hypothetical protein
VTTALETPDIHSPAAATTPADERRPRRWLGLMAVLAATLLNLLDATIVNVAAPSIRAALGGSAAARQWLCVV